MIALFAFLFVGAPNAALAAEDEEANEVEEIVVTGHVLRDLAQTAIRTSRLLAVKKSKMGVTSIGDFLQDIPQNVGGLNAQNNNGGNGSTQLSLRIGSGRTLVLINGRRQCHTQQAVRLT